MSVAVPATVRMVLPDERLVECVAYMRAQGTANESPGFAEGLPTRETIAAEQWSFTPARPALSIERLGFATFSRDGRRVFALGVTSGRGAAAFMFENGRWRSIVLPGIALSQVRAACFLNDGRIVIAGQRALACIAQVDGLIEPWEVQRVREDVDFASVAAREAGGRVELAFAGNRGEEACVAIGSSRQLETHFAPGCTLSSVAFGDFAMVAGTHVGVVTKDGIQIAAPIRGRGGVELAPLDSETVLVRTYDTLASFAPLATALVSEVLPTSSVPIITGAAGPTEAWAIDQRGRFLRRFRRSADSPGWMRMPPGDELAKDPVALWAATGRVRAVCADGRIVDGQRVG